MMSFHEPGESENWSDSPDIQIWTFYPRKISNYSAIEKFSHLTQNLLLHVFDLETGSLKKPKGRLLGIPRDCRGMWNHDNYSDKQLRFSEFKLRPKQIM